MSEITPEELLAQRFVDGVLSPADEERARRWLEEEESFRHLVEELQAVRAAFAGPADQVQAPPGFASRVAFAARVGRGEQGSQGLVTHLTWAAALLLMIGLGLIAGLRINRTSDTLSAEGELEFRYNDLLQQARSEEPVRRKLLLPTPPANTDRVKEKGK